LNRALLVILLFAPLLALAQKAPPAAIVAIRIVGLTRIPPASVQSKLQSRVGGQLDPAIVSDDIKRVYRMGTFMDVQAYIKKTPDGNILLFVVKERPTLNKILFQGNDEMDREDLDKVVDAQTFDVVNEVAIKRIVTKVRDLYVEEGYYLADVTYQLVPQPNNAVNLIFVVDEGQKVEVTSITLLGNTALEDDEVKGIIRTKEGGWLSFLTSSGQFKREVLETDLQMIRAYYLHKGYIMIKVGEPVVTLSDDKRSIDIVIPLEEGEPYSVRKVDVDGDLLFEKDFILSKLKMDPGMRFDSLLMQHDTQAIKALYQDEGYANVTISNASLQDPDTREIEFTYQIQKGEKVHIGRISFEGNETTRDKVMRRVMKIHEGDLYSAKGIARSRAQLMRLGFFERADISTDPGDLPTLMDLTVRVKERQTGTFQVGAGFSSLENFIATAQISKQNFMGHGQTVSLQATLSSIRSLYTLNFFDPYFLDSDWTLSLDLFNFQQDFDNFTRGSTGGSMSWGYRFTDDLSLSLAYKAENVEISIGGLQGTASVPIDNLQQGGLTSSLRTTLTFDSRNDRMFPTAGFFVTSSAEWASEFIGSENDFTRLINRARWYWNPFWHVVLKFNGTLGYVFSNSDRPVPIFERFFVGGIFDVRGFPRNSLGPDFQVASSREPGSGTSPFTIGGNKELIFNVELEIPILKDVGIRGVLFFDAGNAFNDDEPYDLNNLRTSVGFGIRWQSPVGPLRFEWGLPLKPKADEEPIVFEFTIGNSF
jgi:outer membrane protein insertion porin family